MRWQDDHKLREATSNEAYRITWAPMARGQYYSAITPGGRLLEAGADRKKCEDACRDHFAKSRRGKASGWYESVAADSEEPKQGMRIAL